MKTKTLGLALLILSGSAWAQVGELVNADVNDMTSISDPAKAMKDAEGQWLVFSIPALEGTRSPCCWKGTWNGMGNGMGEAGCSLESKHQSYGTRSDSPTAENVIIFSEILDGQLHNQRVVGESCPVDGGGAKVNWIGTVDESAGLDWLESMAHSDNDHSALYALALHRGQGAGNRLYKLAKNSDSDLSEEAIFWLGENRGEEGFNLLEDLLTELPRGDRRREVNFALAQNDTPAAAELLFEISKSDEDPEQRANAMFWLAEEHPQRAQPWLLEVLETEQNEDVLEQAVFAISQLPEGSGDRVLLDLARNDRYSRTVRRQAIFWLAQSENESSVAALTELLTR